MKRMKEYQKPLSKVIAHSPEISLCLGTIDNSTPDTPFFDPNSTKDDDDVIVD